MRSGFSILLMSVLLFSGGYFYYVAQAVCPAPLEYAIGKIDPSFDLTLGDARIALSDAESIWEDATGQNLFTYNPDAKFTVNFIYDERQAYTDAEGSFKQKLDQTQSVSDTLNTTYGTLLKNYDTLQVQYSQKVDQYEQAIKDHNQKVSSYNLQGGVTEEEFDRLEEKQKTLDTERIALSILAKELNSMVAEINKIGDRGNILVETYNRGVKEYNHTFGNSREFTQGTYSSDKRIDIYTYSDMQELRLVIAHEFGHALSLDHVADETSIMYFLIGEQQQPLTLTENDMAEFIRVCQTKSAWGILTERLIN